MTNDPRVPRKAPLPEVFPEQGDAPCTSLIFIRCEGSSEYRLDAQYGEKTGENHHSPDDFRFTITCHRKAIRARPGNGFEGLTTPLPVEQVWI